MPSKVVLISWDEPDDKNWLIESNIALALRTYCPNTHFRVTPEKEIVTIDPWKMEIIRLAKFLRENYPEEVRSNIENPLFQSSAVDCVIEMLSRKQ